MRKSKHSVLRLLRIRAANPEQGIFLVDSVSELGVLCG
jgi:hypothetical protein